MADGSITYQTAPECPFCEGDNIDDGGFCLRCKERVCVIVPAPAWLLKEFGPAGLDGTWGGMSLADMLHDFAWKFAPVEDDNLDPEDFAPSEAYLRRWEGTL